MAKGDQKRAQKRAARGRRQKAKKPAPVGAKVKVVNDRKTIVVSREGDRGWLRFNARGNV